MIDLKASKRTIRQGLLAHAGHKVAIRYYGDTENSRVVTLECDTCHEVLIDPGTYTQRTPKIRSSKFEKGKK